MEFTFVARDEKYCIINACVSFAEPLSVFNGNRCLAGDHLKECFVVIGEMG
jgi:hypothetical protein